MRVGFDFRILSVGRERMNRGMGRFTQQQLAAVLAVDADNDYVVICPPGADLSLVKEDIRDSPAVELREWSPEDEQPLITADPRTLLRRAEEYEGWISRAGIDVYHSTTPFVLYEPTATDFTVCPLVATFYDAIPLIFPAEYMGDWQGVATETYMRAFTQLKRASRLIAISESAKRDASLYAGFPTARIDVAYPVAEPCFRPMARQEVERAIAGLSRRVPIPLRYVLTVSHLHHSKNLGALLQGYAAIPAALRRELPLLICCLLADEEAAQVRRLAANLGIVDDIVLTGLVTDEELAALYNRAMLLVHPSRYEGFGLPVIEAMHCGTPVLTTTTSSLPEAAGTAAALVDPDDALGFADGIQELLDDPNRRLELAQAGLEHVKAFNSHQLGTATLASYEAAAAGNAGARPAGRPRLAVRAGVDLERAGVADERMHLLDQLRTQCDLEVFIDDGCLPPLDMLHRFRVFDASAFERRSRQARFDMVLHVADPDLRLLHTVS